jgi:hypothetical protein
MKIVIFLFLLSSLASSSGTNTGSKTTYSDPLCTVVDTILPVSSTCTAGRTLVGCPSDPFDFGTDSDLVVAT